MLVSRLLFVVMIMASPLLGAVENTSTPLSGTATSIDGKAVSLADFDGKVVLVVNVASRCGFTKQYRQLQALYEKYQQRGLVILGFPCNQFGKQEPGSAMEIKTFCQQKFGVTFPMFSKVAVNGEQAHPLYRFLTGKQVPIADQGPITWNFEKFLIDRHGKVLARYRSAITPDAPEVMAAIEKALGPPVLSEEKPSKGSSEGAGEAP